MRLWHYKLLPYLPKNQILGQHRECCALRGLGWGKKHYIVDYVFIHPFRMLSQYHKAVMNRIENANPLWYIWYYRGKKSESILPAPNSNEIYYEHYPEHNDNYLSICLHNLKYSLSATTKKCKNIDLFKYFSEIIDLGYNLDKKEKHLRNKVYF